MTRIVILACLLIALAPVAEAKGKKPKPAPVAVQPVAPAPASQTPKGGDAIAQGGNAVDSRPATSPGVTAGAAPAPAPSFMEQQIARALANTRPVGVTTYGAAAALQSGGVEAAEAASAGW